MEQHLQRHTLIAVAETGQQRHGSDRQERQQREAPRHFGHPVGFRPAAHHRERRPPRQLARPMREFVTEVRRAIEARDRQCEAEGTFGMR